MTNASGEYWRAAMRAMLVACAAACGGGGESRSDLTGIDDASVRDASTGDTGTLADANETDADSPDAATDAGPIDAHRMLCDGSKSIRFYWRIEPQPARHPPGTDVLDYNGDSYLVITGACEYFMLPGAMAATRRGTLNPQQAEEFSEDTRFDAWPRLAGTYTPPDPGFDVSSLSVSDGSSTVRCAACGSDVSPPVWAIFDAVYRWWETLEAQAEPLDGPLRASVIDTSQAPWESHIDAIAWPLGTPLEALRFDVGADETGRATNLGALLTDETDVATLRQLRVEFLRGDHNWKSYRAIPVNAPSVRVDAGLSETGYSLVFRDVIPLEDADGVIEFPSND
jgi:hypothetical protein